MLIIIEFIFAVNVNDGHNVDDGVEVWIYARIKGKRIKKGNAAT